jgi:hypothetical protein
MDESSYFDENLGYMPAIPLPFYEQSWFGLRKRYMCVRCGAKFKHSGEYECHYALTHIKQVNEDCRTKG